MTHAADRPSSIIGVPFALVRRGLLVALLLAAAGLAVLPDQAAAQTETTLVSNLNVGNDSGFTESSAELAQQFTTGSFTKGYILTGVDVDSQDAQGSSFSASVCTVDSSGHPTTSCTALTAPSDFTAGVLTFTAPSNTVLEAETKYAVLLEPGSEGVSYDATLSTGEDDGKAAGWSIGDASFWNDSGTWRTNAFPDRMLRIAIKGYENPVTTLVANTEQTYVSTNTVVVGTSGPDKLSRAQAFTTGNGTSRIASVQIDISVTHGSSYNPKVSIYTDDSGSPDSSLATLTDPDSLADGLNTFDAGSLSLAANTTYHVVVEATSGTFSLRLTTTNGEDTGAAAGWSIADQHGNRTSDTGNWSSDVPELRIVIDGTFTSSESNSPATGKPAITGVPQVGQTLTAGQGTIADSDGLPSTFPDDYTFQWVRVDAGTGTDIGGATSSTYTLVAADEGKTIKVKVSFTDDASNSEGPLESDPTGTVLAPATGQPAILGVPQVGQTLTAGQGTIADSDGLPSTFPDDYTFQWVRVDAGTGTDIGGATSSTYTLVDADEGKTIRVKVSFTDDDSNSEGPLESAATGTVRARQQDCAADRSGAYWCTTMTVGVGTGTRDGKSGTRYGYFPFGSTTLDDDDVPIGDDTWEVFTLAIFDFTDPGTSDVVTFWLEDGAPELPTGSVLDLGGTEFSAATATLDATAVEYEWPRPANFDWIEGQKVTVSLRGAPPARPETTLVSNAGESGSSSSFSAITVAQSFTTGSHAAGYTLTAVDFPVGEQTNKPDSIKIYTTDSGAPDEELYTLFRPASITANSTNTATAPANATLDPNTTYAVVFEIDFFIGLFETTSDDEDTKQTGWSLWDKYHEYDSTMMVWSEISGTDALQVTVKGTASPTAVTLVSNLDQGNDTSFFETSAELAQQFTTGSSTSGYVLTGVDVDSEDAQGSSFSASVCTVDSDGHPTTSCTALTAPSDFTAGVLTFTAPPGTVLAAETKYAVFLDPGSEGVSYDATLSTGEDDGKADGWSIADDSFWNDDGTWKTVTFPNRPIRIAIKGYEVDSDDDDGDSSDATGQPAITGVPQVGQTLTAGQGTIADGDGLPSTFPDDYTFQWVRVDAGTGANISGATSNTYTLVDADEGKTIRVKVSFTDDDSNSEGPLESAATGTVRARQQDCAADRPDAYWCTTMTVGVVTSPISTGYGYIRSPSNGALADGTIVSGGSNNRVTQIMLWDRFNPSSEDIVSVELDAWEPAGSVFNFGGIEFAGGRSVQSGDYEWRRPPNMTWIEGQKVTVSLRGGSSNATGKPSITGVPQVGQTLTAGQGTIADSDGLPSTFPDDYTFQWVRVDAGTGTDIGGATSHTYTLADADEGKTIKVEVSFTDDDSNSEGPLESDPTGTVLARQQDCATDRPGSFWCTTMTVGVETSVAGLTGYGFIHPTGALVNRFFDYDGTTYRVDQVVIVDYHNPLATDEIGFEHTTGRLPAGSFFNFGGEEFHARNDRDNLSDSYYEWRRRPNMTWIEGQKVTVSLRGPSQDTTLSALRLERVADDSKIALSPDFRPGNTAYRTSVWNDEDQITVRPTTNDSNAIFGILGPADADTEKPGHQVALSSGSNTISVRVTASDLATTRTYTITVTRRSASLPTISVADATATPDDHYIAFTVSLSKQLGQGEGVEFRARTVGGNANFTHVGDVYYIQPYRTSQKVWVELGNNSVGKTVRLEISDARLTDASTGRPLLEITDDEATGSIVAAGTATAVDGYAMSIENANTPETGGYESWRSIHFKVKLSPSAYDLGEHVCFAYATVTGGTTATPDVDYHTTSGRDWFSGRAAGAFGHTVDVVVHVIDDDIHDGGETVRVRISEAHVCGDASRTITISRNTAIGTIYNHDPHPPPSESDAGATATPAIWQSTMTTGFVYQDYGYIALEDSQRGSLTTGSFDVAGETYTLKLIEASDWIYIGLDKKLPFDFTLSVDGAELESSDASHTSYSYAEVYMWSAQDIYWDEGDEVALAIYRKDPPVSGEAASNNAATGSPTISGTAQVGRTLTASTSGISDADGLTSVSYSYQWIRNDGTDDSDISGATGSAYSLVDADQGKTIKVKVTFTDDASNDEERTSAATGTVAARPNSPATGTPTITGTAQVGQTLTANTSGISDADGLTSVSYGYQWIRNDGTADADISGATGSAYSLVDADQGKTIKVKVAFTDDRDNNESLTSAATGEVAEAPSPLTVRLENEPSTHNGTAVFTFQIRFSEEFPLSYRTLRDHAFTVSGGELKKAERLEKGSNIGWLITAAPESDGDVTISLPATTDCADDGAICTEDGRKLSNSLEFTVDGPG